MASTPTPLLTRARALRALPLALTFALALTACGGGDDGPIRICTTEWRYAVMVEPFDELGRALDGVQISWRLNGGNAQTETCTLLPCGVDGRGGQYELTASKPGHESASTSLRVEHDGCHALTERWRPTLRKL
jgi:hypothetical protein